MLRKIFASIGFEGYVQRLKERGAHDAQLNQLVDDVIKKTDKRLQWNPRHKKALREPVENAFLLSSKLAYQISDPVEVSRASYSTHPLVTAMFSGVDHMGEVLHQGDVLPGYFRTNSSSDVCHVVVGVFPRHGVDLDGVEMHGEILRRGVRQETFGFSDHWMMLPSGDAEGMRTGLQDHLFNRLVEYAAVERVRESETHREKNRGKDIPLERSLKIVKDILSRPNVLDVANVEITVDRMGKVITHTGQERYSVLPLDFQQVSIGENRPWAIVPISVPRSCIDCNLPAFNPDRALTFL